MAGVRVPENAKGNNDSMYQWVVPRHILSFLHNIL